MANPISLSRFDVVALARVAGVAVGDHSAFVCNADAGLVRLAAESCVPGGLSSVSWRLQADMRPDAADVPQPWLHVEASAVLPLVCQRCLDPVGVPLVVDRWFRFVADEDTAQAEDDVSDEDVLVLEPRMDAATLIEDELLMAIPLVPMHVECPTPVSMAVVDPGFEAALTDRPKPFAGLDQVKLPRSAD